MPDGSVQSIKSFHNAAVIQNLTQDGPIKESDTISIDVLPGRDAPYDFEINIYDKMPGRPSPVFKETINNGELFNRMREKIKEGIEPDETFRALCTVYQMMHQLVPDVYPAVEQQHQAYQGILKMAMKVSSIYAEFVMDRNRQFIAGQSAEIAKDTCDKFLSILKDGLEEERSLALQRSQSSLQIRPVAAAE